MIFGIGFDIVNINRFEVLSDWSPRLTTQYLIENKNINSLAGEFAAREALIKAINQVCANSMLFIGKDISNYELLRAVTLIDSPSGSREFLFNDPYKQLFRDFSFMLSISHDPPIAGAVVVAILNTCNT